MAAGSIAIAVAGAGLLNHARYNGSNVFASSTGRDGGFPVLLALDAQNRPAALLSDFGVLSMDYGGIHTV